MAVIGTTAIAITDASTTATNAASTATTANSTATNAASTATVANSTANNAVTLANQKNKAYTSTSAPTSTSGYVSGDLWYVLSSGVVTAMYCYTGSAWTKYTQDAATLSVGTLSALSANLGNVTAGNLSGVNVYGAKYYAGTPSTNTNNTASVYPLTINTSGQLTSSTFGDDDSLQTKVISGGANFSYRGMQSNTGEYEAYDVSVSGNQIVLKSGYTTSKDTTFSTTLSGDNLTGQVILSPLTGLELYGNTQTLTFNGLTTDTNKGITFTIYGNIKGNANQGTWILEDNNSSTAASFGIDTSTSNPINFYRELWVSNMGLGLAHQIRSKDGGGIYFTDDDSNRVDTYHKNIYYSGSASKSLLSEKQHVNRANTQYWSNLINNILLGTYQYNDDDYTAPLRLSGIIDDVNVTKQWSLPEAFYARDEKNTIIGIDNGVLLNAAIATIQTQQTQIDQLNGHALEMEARIHKLEMQNNG